MTPASSPNIAKQSSLSPVEMRVIEAMQRLVQIRRMDRVYPYQLVVFTDVGYSEQHLRRVMRRMAQLDIITRVGGDRSRRGYTLMT
jgi:hypothetical protein